MGARYNVARGTHTASITNDSVTLIAPSTRALKIWAIRVVGAGTTSGYNELGIYRSTVGTTGGGAITPGPKATLSAASGVSAWTTWSVQPTAGQKVDQLGYNVNGGINAKVYPPGLEIDVPPSGQISFRGVSGTGACALDFDFEEVG